MAHNGELTVKRTTSSAPVSDIDPANVEDIARELNALLGRRLLPLPEDEELSLAHERPTFS